MSGIGAHEGAYHRRIRLVADEWTVRGDLEDDFHHFTVHLGHDGDHVVTVVGDAVRYPWTTCPAARAATKPARARPSLE